MINELTERPKHHQIKKRAELAQPRVLTLKDGSKIAEHRFIMEEYLGRKLDSFELVHHCNHNKHDNRIENLELITINDHISHHMKNFYSTSVGVEKVSKLTKKDVLFLRKYFKENSHINKYTLAKKICKKYGVCKETIVRAVIGKHHHYLKEGITRGNSVI